MGRKLKNGDRGTAKFIRISDESKWDFIDKLLTLDKFKSNFNKLINDALVYGLPKLYAVEFGVTVADETATSSPKEKDNMGDDYLKIIRLLREIIVNENINKSILCSLFQVKSKELDEVAVREQFNKGYYQETPDFLADYEIRELKKLRD